MTCPESCIRPLKPGSPTPRASLLSVGVQLLFAKEMGDWGRSVWTEVEEQSEGRRGLLEGAPLTGAGCSSLLSPFETSCNSDEPSLAPSSH